MSGVPEVVDSAAQAVDVFCPPNAEGRFERIPTGEMLMVRPVPGAFQLVRVEVGNEHAVVYAHELFLAMRVCVVEAIPGA